MYAAVQPFSKYFNIKTVRIYDTIFILHTKFTAVLLLACSALLSANQYFGSTINCLGDEKNIDFANQYCWTMGTFIWNYYDISNSDNSLDTFMKNTVKYSIAEGVGPELLGKTERLYLRYYQWVVFLLILESLIFYFPAFLWKMWEAQRLEHLCHNIRNPLLSPEIYQRNSKMIYKYFSTNNKKLHKCYLIRYVFCEVLNLFISIINIMTINLFFDRFWSKYLDVIMTLPYYEWNTWNHMSSRVFPKMAKCSLPIYGVAGSHNHYDLLCILPLNILNEKVFAFLWAWFLLMTLLAVCNLIYRLIIICSPNIRMYLLRVRLLGMSKEKINLILSKSSVGDWFVLNKVGSNINPVLFNDVMLELYNFHLENYPDDISV